MNKIRDYETFKLRPSERFLLALKKTQPNSTENESKKINPFDEEFSKKGFFKNRLSLNSWGF
jgi:hypothetical protein